MSQEIQKVAVIGAGVMGAGIAAQVANAGIDVVLLDIVPKDAKDRNIVAKTAVEKLKKTNPAPLMHKRNAKRIQVGNVEDDLKLLKECDWIIEAVIERLDIKHDLYKKISKHRKKDAIISSNTSTLPLGVLTKGLPKSFGEHFMITHFFNPPRYLRLLEIVTGKDTDKKAVKRVKEFADHQLGKSLVTCKDTPGFIANRIGTFWIHAAVVTALKQGIGVEEADAVLSRPCGVPRTGVFGLVDLVGLDLMPHIIESFEGTLSKDDAFIKLGKPPKILEKMVKDGYTGRKGKGGFYRLNDKKKKEVIDLNTGKYSLAKRPKVPAAEISKKEGLRGTVTHNSDAGRYAWIVLAKTLHYAASLVPEISDNIEQVDRAMRLGYNWKFGPFELIDKLGTDWLVAQFEAEGLSTPKILEVAGTQKLYTVKNGVKSFLGLDGKYHPVPRPKGVLLLEDIKRQNKPIFTNRSASVWDIGDKIACLEFHSKMNSLNPFSVAIVNKAAKELPKQGYKGLVIYNEGSNFSAGANLAMVVIVAKLKLFPLVRWILYSGQMAFQKLKYAPIPVVGAPSGLALGGGCEVLLHCDAIEAHAETYTGLVEVGVGIVPGWGGCKEMLGRFATSKKHPKGPMPAVSKSFEQIATAMVAKSADEAKDMLILRPEDGVVMNKERVLASAKAKALELSKNYEVPQPYTYKLPGDSGKSALELALQDFKKRGLATPHDVTIGKQLAFLLTGGNTDVTEELAENDILKLERDSLIKLLKTKESQARVMHMLKKGKPLRN